MNTLGAIQRAELFAKVDELFDTVTKLIEGGGVINETIKGMLEVMQDQQQEIETLKDKIALLEDRHENPHRYN